MVSSTLIYIYHLTLIHNVRSTQRNEMFLFFCRLVTDLKHYCRVCNTELNSCRQTKIHVSGKKHNKRLSYLEYSIKSTAGAASKLVPSTASAAVPASPETAASAAASQPAPAALSASAPTTTVIPSQQIPAEGGPRRPGAVRKSAHGEVPANADGAR